MKKFIHLLLLVILSLITLIIIYLSTVGLETSKFNNIVIKEIKKKDPNIQITLNIYRINEHINYKTLKDKYCKFIDVI